LKSYTLYVICNVKKTNKRFFSLKHVVHLARFICVRGIKTLHGASDDKQLHQQPSPLIMFRLEDLSVEWEMLYSM
jgi:hypothetical protein